MCSQPYSDQSQFEVWGLLGFICNTAPFLVQIRSVGAGFCKACTDLIGFVVLGVLCKQSPSFLATYSCMIPLIILWQIQLLLHREMEWETNLTEIKYNLPPPCLLLKKKKNYFASTTDLQKIERYQLRTSILSPKTLFNNSSWVKAHSRLPLLWTRC